MKIYKINDEKFKTICVSYNFTMEVKDTKIYSRNALLASLMIRESQKYKSQKEIIKYLNELYGASLDVNVEKYGDLYNMEFKVEFINKKFLPNEEELEFKILDFLKEIIYNPSDWSNDLISRQKKFVEAKISERKDEKLRYGIERTEEIMCKNEPFGTYIYGDEATVESTTKNELKEAYNNVINSCITVMITGNLSGYEKIATDVKNVFSSYDNNPKALEDLNYNSVENKPFEYEQIHEVQDTVQSVLGMDLRINNVNDFYKINVYCAVLGTTPSSKLFQNVREKNSLAYTVRSRYYRYKNFILIYAGINRENYDKAVEVIKEQLDAIKNGKVTEIEFNSAKDSIIADLNEIQDSKMGMAKMKFANLITFKDENITLNDMIKNFSAVTFEDILDVAKNVEIEKLFLLGGN